jgi:hypothetical protein
VAKKSLTEQQDMAANYGWALSVLRSNPELSKLFDNAVGGNWDSQRFVANLRNTKWYKTHSESNRQNQVLKGADPAEYNRRLQQSKANVASAYTAMFGQAPNSALLNSMAMTAFTYGYNDAELKDMIGKSFNVATQMKNGIGGTLGEAERLIRQAIDDYGLDMGEPWIARQLNYVATGRTDATATANYLQKQAISKYSAYKDELEAGMTVKDIAEPFRQLMAKTLELSDKGIAISDPTIQKALQNRAPAKGKVPGAPAQMPLWQFETQLKNDQRWNGTQNAQDSIMAAGRKVLADWGLTTGSAA